MTKEQAESIKKAMDRPVLLQASIHTVFFTNEIEEEFGITISWTVEKVGTGEIDLIYNPKTNSWLMQTEHMSKEFIKEVLGQIIDKAVVVDPPHGKEDEPEESNALQ